VPRSILRTSPRQPTGGCSPRVPFTRARRCPPCDGYGLESMSWEVGLARIELALFAGPYNLIVMGDRCGPVEAMAERVAHEGVRCSVMAAHGCVDVLDELLTVGNGDASLQDPGCGTLVQLAVNHGERFGLPGDAPDLGPIRGKVPTIDPGELFGPPILRMWRACTAHRQSR
jgi:hypothetical protein